MDRCLVQLSRPLAAADEAHSADGFLKALSVGPFRFAFLSDSAAGTLVLSAFASYRHLPRHIVLFTMAEFCLHLGNAAFFLILNIYMRKSGYADSEIGNFLTGRHFMVMLLAYPAGLLVRRSRILPFLYASATAFPILSFLLVAGVARGWDLALYPVFALWGAAFFSVRAVAVPYMLRNCPEERHSEALALNFASWSVAMIGAGALNYILTQMDPVFFTEQRLLQGFAAVGVLSFLFLSRIKHDVYVPVEGGVHRGDLSLIATALAPTVVIAVGAGLTIQFMNLFFFNVFGVDYDVFSLMGAVTSALASIAVLFVPKLKARFGYRGAITATQSGAVLALIGLATTAYYAGAVWALVLAVVLYALRQPLMNMANPMTSELAMYYVGERNREMTSAMTGAVWSGSWFFSAIIFSRLRAADVGYAPIFYITAALYALGVVGFYQLINRYERREAGRSGALRLRAQSAGDGPRPVSGPHGAAERSNAGAQPDAQAGAQGLSGSPGSSSSTTSTERSSIG